MLSQQNALQWVCRVKYAPLPSSRLDIKFTEQQLNIRDLGFAISSIEHLSRIAKIRDSSHQCMQKLDPRTGNITAWLWQCDAVWNNRSPASCSVSKWFSGQRLALSCRFDGVIGSPRQQYCGNYTGCPLRDGLGIRYSCYIYKYHVISKLFIKIIYTREHFA